MREFNWTVYKVPVRIAGVDFELACDSEAADTIKELSEALKEIAKNFKTTSKEEIKETYSACFDKLLGEGASSKIMDGRDVKTSDLNDLTMFLIQTYNEFRNERLTGAAKHGEDN